jgi:hypothetical protein
MAAKSRRTAVMSVLTHMDDRFGLFMPALSGSVSTDPLADNLRIVQLLRQFTPFKPMNTRFFSKRILA